MRQRIKFVWKCIGLILLGAVVGTVLLTGVFLIPTNGENVQKSYEIIEKEGWYPAMPVLTPSLDTYFNSHLPGVLDDNSDRVILETAIETNETSPLRSAMDMLGYSYYWHGYVAILRPLLALFDYGQIRFLNGMLQTFLAFCLVHFLWKEKGKAYGMVAATSFALLMPMAMQMCLHFSWVFHITYGASLFLLYHKLYWEKEENLYLAFLLIGMCTSFFELLTYPLYTWGIPLVWVIATDEKGNNPWNYLKRVILTGCSWVAGYAGIWACKWLIGSLVLKRNILQSAIEQVFLRVGAKEETVLISDRLHAMYTNWKHYEYKIYFMLFVVWVIWMIYRSVKNGCRYNHKSWALLLIASSCVVWYFVLYNHTRIHHFFTYRIWGIGIAAFLVFWCECLQEKEKKKDVKQMGISLLCWGMVVVCSAGLALLAREDISVINGDKAYYEREISDTLVATVAFTPSFQEIKQISLGIRTEASQGDCMIKIYDQSELLYSEKINLSDMGESTYVSHPVRWKLKPGKTYHMQISTENSIGATYLLVTDNGEMPLSEYQSTAINGELTAGQPISGIVYHHRPFSKKTLVFLMISWMGVVGAVFVQIEQAVVHRKNQC